MMDEAEEEAWTRQRPRDDYAIEFDTLDACF
jgi:hypothetical protein